jgi:hypothetical protein
MLTAITDTESKYLERRIGTSAELHQDADGDPQGGFTCPATWTLTPRGTHPWVASQVIRNREAADPGALLP